MRRDRVCLLLVEVDWARTYAAALAAIVHREEMLWEGLPSQPPQMSVAMRIPATMQGAV
ncbi:MAG: hypothetical protein U0232_11560 [Thermomicrobiales bacterium]